MKVQNLKTEEVIDVPTDHAINVLIRQGNYKEYKPSTEQLTLSKKRGRPRKENQS